MKKSSFLPFGILFFILIFTLTTSPVFCQQTLEPEKLYETEDRKNGLEIFSNVPDVNVYLNGVYQGKTNLKVFELTSGYYQLALEKPGYFSREEIIYVKPYYGQRYFIEMEKAFTSSED